MKKLVIMPAYNEEANIAGIIARVQETAPDADVLVINDCSGDQTAAAARAAGAAILSHVMNMGYSITLQTGYKYAARHQYDIVIQLDADGQHDPACIPQMLTAMEDAQADVVIGSRFIKKTAYAAPVFRRLGMRFFSFLILLVTGKKIFDPTSGFRVISRSVLPLLVSEQFPCDYPDADLIILITHAGFSITECSVEMSANREGRSMHNGIIGNMFYIFKVCLSIFLIAISTKTKRSA